MTRFAPLLVILAAISLFFFPWPLTTTLVLLASPVVPVAPLALGLSADALYRTPGVFPLATLLGACASLLALFVRTRLTQGVIAP